MVEGTDPSLPVWITITVFIISIAALFIGKKFLFRFLGRWTEKTKYSSAGLFLHSLNHAATILLLAGACSFIPVVFSLPIRWAQTLSLVARLLVAFSIAFFVQRLLLALHQKYIAAQESFRSYSGIVRVLISGGVYSVFILIFLETSGISVTPLVASLGIGSIAVALGLQETLASLFSGLYILADKPIRVGDFVRLETGQEGYVESIGWRSSRIRMLSNNIVIIPNSKLAGSIITNYYLPSREIGVPVEISVDPACDLEQIERIALEVALQVMKEIPGGVPHFEPVLRFQSFGGQAIQFSVSLRARDFTDQSILRHEFIRRFHKRFREQADR